MPLGTFCNKLSAKHPTQFTDAEIIRFKMVLRELQADIEGVTEIDFNDTLKAITK